MTAQKCLVRWGANNRSCCCLMQCLDRRVFWQS